jgi:hypothetical protein
MYPISNTFINAGQFPGENKKFEITTFAAIINIASISDMYYLS